MQDEIVFVKSKGRRETIYLHEKMRVYLNIQSRIKQKYRSESRNSYDLYWYDQLHGQLMKGISDIKQKIKHFLNILLVGEGISQ